MEDTPTLLMIEDFLPLVGQTFGASVPSDAASFVLAEAKALTKHGYPGSVRDPFALYFVSDNAPPVQGLCRFDLPGMGATDIFLVPVERRDDGIVFEAVFN